MFSFYRINTYTKLLRIGTQQYSPHIYILPISNSIFTSIIVLKFMSQLKIYTKRKIVTKKQNLVHKCILQGSCKPRDIITH